MTDVKFADGFKRTCKTVQVLGILSDLLGHIYIQTTLNSRNVQLKYEHKLPLLVMTQSTWLT